MESRRDVEAARDEVVVQLMTAPMEQREVLIEEYRQRAEAAFALSTRRNLAQMQAMFIAWCREAGHSTGLPCSPVTVAAYVDYLGGKIRPSTVELRLWAISEMHRAAFMASPCPHRLVELSLKAVKRTYGAAERQATPLGKREIIDTIGRMGSSRIEMRDKAVLWITSDTWCRASEVVAFRVCDLSAQEDGSSVMFIARSKTDQYGQGNFAYLSRHGTRAVHAWIKLAGLKGTDPLLTKSQRGGKVAPLNPATLSRILQRCTGRADVSAHSTRVGGVQDALRIGCDIASIMVAGRWTSPEMPARYGRRILAGQSAAAKVSAAFADAASEEEARHE